MHTVVLDFETFYDKDYTLSKLTTQEYINDPQFQIIGCAIKIDATPTKFYHRDDWKDVLTHLHADGQPLILVAHNALFDLSIVTSQLPKLAIAKICCTLSMARALGLSAYLGASLAKTAQYLQSQGLDIPDKGTEVLNALGKHYEDFTPEQLTAYAQYCVTDVEICSRAFNAMLPYLPAAELAWQDIVMRMHAYPVLQLNRATLEADLLRVQVQRQKLLDGIKAQLGVTDDAQMLTMLRSNERFANLLRECNVEPPTKVSTTTGKPTYAFAKTDEAFKALLDHPNPRVQALAQARLGTKSSIEQTRLEKFIRLSQFDRFAVPLLVSGAHTHRLGGLDRINVQNMPSGRVAGQSTAMRMAIEAPEGQVVVAADSSQIEVRVLAYVANQEDLLDNFRHGVDPYCALASRIYGLPADEIKAGHKAGDAKYTKMRQISKAVLLGCIAEDTEVLTDRGWIAIQDVKATDLLWDGEQYVPHDGVLSKGEKSCIEVGGVWVTPDHKIFDGDIWNEAKDVDTGRGFAYAQRCLPDREH